MNPVIRGPTSKWQFSLRHVFVGVVAANGLFAMIAWDGIFGALLFAVALGISLLLFGACKYDWRFVGGGIALSLVASALLKGGGTVALGVGWTNRSCAIQVCEQTTGDYIPGATVRIQNVWSRGGPDWVPQDSDLVDETGIGAVTDESGIVVIPLRFQFTERHGRFINEARLSIPENCWLQIDAPGYKREIVLLQSFTGNSHDYFVPLPKIKISLKRS